MSPPLLPKFGYAYLKMAPDRGNNYTELMAKNAPDHAFMKNDGFYLVCDKGELDTVSRDLGIPRDAFEFHKSGRSNFYAYEVKSPVINEQVEDVLASVIQEKIPPLNKMQTILDETLKVISCDKAAMPGWAAHAFNLFTWIPRPQICGLGSNDAPGLMVDNLKVIHPAG